MEEDIEIESKYHAQSKKSSQPKNGLCLFKSGVGGNYGLSDTSQKVLLLIVPAI